MRFLLKVSMVLSFFLFIVGCYESEVAMAPVKEAVFDAKLIGRWKAVGLEYDEAAKLVILNFNDREYFIQHNLWEKRDWSVRSEVYLCRAYTIMVDGAAFCNVQYISSDEKEKRPFMFFKYSFSKDGILTWQWVS
ncbi:MAG: hypothetical protein HKO91_12940, partial [Desulfobacterales bacterium]|nr:hypothetical protein [Desulfobacterales bacterium]